MERTLAAAMKLDKEMRSGGCDFGVGTYSASMLPEGFTVKMPFKARSKSHQGHLIPKAAVKHQLHWSTTMDEKQQKKTDYSGAIIDLEVVDKTFKPDAEDSPHINRNHDEQPPPPEISHAAKTVNKARLLRMKKTDPFVSNFT